MDASSRVSWTNLGKRIRFFTPSFIPYRLAPERDPQVTFLSISVTGRSCAMKCKHCSGRLLNTMNPVRTPKELVEVCERLADEEAKGCLISGGCDPNGSVPLKGFIEAIAHVKKQTDLKLVVHTGLIDPETAEGLKMAGVDSALIDVVGSDETIREVLQSTATVEDYGRSLGNLRDTGLRVVPHLVVGLHYGYIKGEVKALDLIAQHKPSAVIIIAFTPLRGTAMEHVKPSTPGEIARVLFEARKRLPSTPLALGCMRPKGSHRAETDILAVEAGVNAIAFPSPEAVSLSEALGLEASFSSLCCSQVYEPDQTGMG